MEVYLARQPIFDKNIKVRAYEILYRSGMENYYQADDAEQASASVLINSFQSFGIDNLTGKKPVFINFTEEFINQEIATLFPRELLVVEILETVIPGEEIVEKCKTLKEAGYTLALDDFVYSSNFVKLLEIVDIIKVDFLLSSHEEIERILPLLKSYNLRLLAEKIETRKEFEYAKNLGFELFQGFFFSKPEIVSTRNLSPLEINYLNIISYLNGDDIDYDVLAEMIARDISLTYNLFRLVRSAYFSYKSKSDSIKHALAFLGIKEIKKWLTLLVLSGIGKDKPDELLRTSMIRAHFAERLSESSSFEEDAEDLFLSGLFSLLDALMGRPLNDILEDAKVSDNVQNIILKKADSSVILSMIEEYERGNWDNVRTIAEKNDIDHQIVVDAYFSAISWYDQFTTTMFA